MYMENVKEHYWRYSLITIILGLGVILFFKITPFLGGILGAFTIYILLRGQLFHLTEKLNMRPAFAALLLQNRLSLGGLPNFQREAYHQT